MTEITIDLTPDEGAAAGILLGMLSAGSAGTRIDAAGIALLEKILIAMEESTP